MTKQEVLFASKHEASGDKSSRDSRKFDSITCQA